MADRLFDPGPKAPDAWKLHPDKWVQQPDVVYHATDAPALPRKDRGPNLSVDYGGSSGMHFGNKQAAYERAKIAGGERKYIHTARLNATQFTTQKGTPHTDDAANYGELADRAVREGKVVPYKNDYEADGSTSFRVKPESVRTWSEDVQADPTAHPALQHLASRGYNPTFEKRAMVDHTAAYYSAIHGKRSDPGFFDADVVKGGKAISHHVDEESAMKKTQLLRTEPGNYNVGFKRNNEGHGSFYEEHAVESAQPTLRPTRPDW